MKKLLYLAGGLALLLLAVYLGGKAFANGKLDELIEKANQAGNKLEINNRDLSFSLLYAGLELDSITLSQTVGGRRISGTIAHLDLDGLSVLKAINGNISIGDLLIKDPVLEIHPAAVVLNPIEIPDTLAQKISIDELSLVDGQLSVFDEAGELKAKVLGVTSTASLNLPLAPAAAPTISVTADSLFFPATDNTDQSMNAFALDTEKRTLSIGTFRVSPKQAARTYLTSIKYKQTWQALRLDGITATDFPFDSLLAGGVAMVPNLSIGNLNLSVFENPSLERDPAEPNKPFPVEAFRKLPYPLLLKSLIIARANIAYGVHKEGAEKPDITFAGSIKAGNFSTWKQDAPAFAEADFTFEETSPLNARFELDQTGDGRDFAATGQLDDYDLTNINPLMLVAAGADIESGHVDQMTHNFSIRDGVATGELVFKYHKLEVKMEGKGAWLINMIEDVAIRDSNPRNDGDLVIGRVSAEHDPTRSFFNLYWKSLVSGMTSSVAGSVFVSGKSERIEARN